MKADASILSRSEDVKVIAAYLIKTKALHCLERNIPPPASQLVNLVAKVIEELLRLRVPHAYLHRFHQLAREPAYHDKRVIYRPIFKLT